eukprot:GILJ01004473.1.p1 GENE.GILJ01004473.1~~GILJ01004473.1.p1  ORF type:complete len:315 (+),score=31.08 GILJ01004473.1:44-988(+)
MSDSEDMVEEFIPFKERPEWADVQPVPQVEASEPIVPIEYSQGFRETMDYYRAIVQKDERSERALKLTEEVIDQNASNYSAWYFRRLCLEHLRSDLRQELDYVSEVGLSNPKNYQIWYHRKVIVEKLDDASQELDFTAAILSEDAKNYHAWSYRQWVLKRFHWKDELKYVNLLFDMDIRNNSAWNQRYYVIKETEEITHDVITREANFSMNAIRSVPHNEAAWNYLKGWLGEGPNREPFARHAYLRAFCEDMANRHQKCRFALALLLDICQEEKTRESLVQAQQVCDKLVAIDNIRRKYWLWRQAKFVQLEKSL